MRTFMLALSEDMLQVVSHALGAQPFQMVAPTIAEIQKQVDAQLARQPSSPPILKQVEKD